MVLDNVSLLFESPYKRVGRCLPSCANRDGIRMLERYVWRKAELPILMPAIFELAVDLLKWCYPAVSDSVVIMFETRP